MRKKKGVSLRYLIFLPTIACQPTVEGHHTSCYQTYSQEVLQWQLQSRIHQNVASLLGAVHTYPVGVVAASVWKMGENYMKVVAASV